MFYIRMAGLTIGIRPLYRYVYELCKDYRTQAERADIEVSVTDEEIAVVMKEADVPLTAGYCEALCVCRKISMQLPLYDAFLIHGAAIAVDGEAYLFLARSGVGKSTHIGLWEKAFGERAQILNGDKPVLRRFEGQWCVCGTPWRGKEELGVNQIVPLKALCFLERGQENIIAPVSRTWATGHIFNQVLLPREEEPLTAFFDLLDDVLARIPCYRLQCNQQTEAARMAYAGMQKR